jgi:protein SCO1/2
MSKARKLSFILSGLVIVLSLLVYWVAIRPQQQYYASHHVDIQGVYLLKPRSVKHLELTDNKGKPFTKANLQHHWTFLFFGFTHCSSICPTTLSALNQTYQLLAQKPQVVFVTIDPARDSIARLNQYVLAFNPHFIGARMGKEMADRLEKEWYITSSQGANTINHSSVIILINPDAKIQAYFSYPAKPQQMAKDYQAILANYARTAIHRK